MQIILTDDNVTHAKTTYQLEIQITTNKSYSTGYSNAVALYLKIDGNSYYLDGHKILFNKLTG